MGFRYKITSQADNKLALLEQGRVVWAFSEHREGCQKRFFAINHNFNKPQNLFSLLREMSRVLRVTEGCQCANLRFTQAFNERPYDLTL